MKPLTFDLSDDLYRRAVLAAAEELAFPVEHTSDTAFTVAAGTVFGALALARRTAAHKRRLEEAR